MLMAVLMAGALGFGWLLAGTATTSHATRTRDARRRRWVERHPGEVNSGDVERELLAHGLSLSDVRLVSAKATDLHIRPFSMWMFARTFGARDLAIAVAGDLAHETMLEHLGAGTAPAFEQLEVFARLNGLDAVAEPGRRRPLLAPQTVCAPGSRTLADLDVTEPGRGLGPDPDDDPDPDRPRRFDAGWGGSFDDVAA